MTHQNKCEEINDDFAKDTELYGEFLLEFRLYQNRIRPYPLIVCEFSALSKEVQQITVFSLFEKLE